MKTQNNFLQALNQAQLTSLTNEVKETVAVIPALHHKSAFGIVDLWNLERNSRRRITRRHLV